MAKIPIANLENYFDFMLLPFEIQHFELPETKYSNGNISLFETVIICLICRNIDPKNVLEFGTFNGRTTINIAANIPDDGEIITVDLPKACIKDTKYPLEGAKETDANNELGYVGTTNKLYTKNDRYRHKINQFWMDTAIFPIPSYQGYFDFIFVDASHAYENVLNDSKTALKCIKKNGTIMWHDYDGWPGVTDALDEIYDESENKYCFAQIKGTSLVIYYNI